jgi:NADPH:quinone reductase-like Zn-dependent oxidoreductase
VSESALDGEITDHLGYHKHDPAGKNGGNNRALAPDGRLLIIGGDVSPTPLGIGELISKRATVAATTLRSRSHRQEAEIVDAVRANLWPMVTSGRVRPVVDSVVPMDSAARAHQLLADGKVVGEVVLTV